MSQPLNTQSLSPKAADWLHNTNSPKILHIFNPVCNLVNENKQVLSLVIPQIGNGPFNLVVEGINFNQHITNETKTQINQGVLQLGQFSISPNDAQSWNPQPNWTRLKTKTIEVTPIKAILKQHAPDDSIARLILNIPFSMPQKVSDAVNEGISLIHQGISQNDLEPLKNGAKRLAGLGVGLTPAGDDYLIGVMHGLWAKLDITRATKMCQVILDASLDRTTTISQAWLIAAAAGEAGEVWHDFLDAIAVSNENKIKSSVMRILPTGHTSGSDALAGFVDTLELLQ